MDAEIDEDLACVVAAGVAVIKSWGTLLAAAEDVMGLDKFSTGSGSDWEDGAEESPKTKQRRDVYERPSCEESVLVKMPANEAVLLDTATREAKQLVSSALPATVSGLGGSDKVCGKREIFRGGEQHRRSPCDSPGVQGKTKNPDVTPALGIQEILTSHPKSSRWLTQTEVENDPKMNLQAGSLGAFYALTGLGIQRRKIRAETIRQLEAKGVYRERGSQCPKRVWWFAFVGEGGAKPRFDIREREHLFVETDPVEKAAAQGAPRRRPLEGTALQRAACEAEEDISADAPREKSGQEEHMRVSENVVLRQRRAWVHSPCFVKMIGTSTYDYFFSVQELGDLLDMPCSEIRAILQPRYRAGHPEFLRSFGITSRLFDGRQMYCLLGEGSLVSMGGGDCIDLINAEPNPMYWRATKWEISKSNTNFAGLEISAVVNLTSEVQESLHCRSCGRSVAAGDWAWQRLESKLHAILNPDRVVQLGVKFRCISCKAIHLAVPLPCHKGRGDGSVWARGDPAVDVIVSSLPSWNGSKGQAPGEVSNCDAKNKKHRKTEKEFTATIEPPQDKQRQSGKSKACLAAGVSEMFLVARKHEMKTENKCCEVQVAWTCEQAAVPAAAANVVTAKAPIGAAAAAVQAKTPRGVAEGQGFKAPNGVAAAAQAKAPRGAARGQAESPRGSAGDQSKATNGAPAEAQEEMSSEAAAGGPLSRYGRVRKRKMLADM